MIQTSVVRNRALLNRDKMICLFESFKFIDDESKAIREEFLRGYKVATDDYLSPDDDSWTHMKKDIHPDSADVYGLSDFDKGYYLCMFKLWGVE